MSKPEADDFKEATSGETGFLDLLAKMRPDSSALILVLLVMLLQSVVSLAMPLFAGHFAQTVFVGQPVSGWLLGLFWLVVAQSLLGYFSSVRAGKIALDMVARLGKASFDHIQLLPLLWHQERQRGAVVSLLTQDVERIGRFITGTVLPVVPLLLTAAGALVMMLRISWWVGLMMGVMVPVLVIVLRLVGRKLRPMAHRVMGLYADRTAAAEQGLVMLPVVKSFAAERVESARYASLLTDLRVAELRILQLQSALTPFVRITASACLIGLLWLASHELADGSLRPDQLVSLLLYGLLLIQPVSGLASTYGAAVAARGSAQRLLETFSQAPEPDHGQQRPEVIHGELHLQELGFSYPQRARLFDGIDLHIAAGETVAIIGANGEGKSTLAHLILRLLQPDRGRILFDGLDVRELPLTHLRRSVGLVSQNVLLFNDSIAANIAYARPGASREDVRRAAVAARADEFVMGLQDGYETVIGDQGVRLSGGQKQRIALARTLLADSAVLILDEATAMFDPEGEMEFIRECHALFMSRTVLLITHRSASLALADRVFRLQDGKLVQIASSCAEDTPE